MKNPGWRKTFVKVREKLRASPPFPLSFGRGGERGEVKKQQFCKQDSVIFYHLSEPEVTIRLYRPTPPGFPLPEFMRAACYRFFLSEIAKSGIYMVFQPVRFTHPGSHLPGSWAFTPRFHPYPDPVFRLVPGWLFSVALSVSRFFISREPSR